jgi:tripartite-type tricarboxylate transporter receptor subunit TctC
MVSLLHREIATILQAPEVKKRMALDEIEVKVMTSTELTQYIAAEIARWAPLAKSLNLTIE